MSGSTISFARGAPSLDIVDVQGLKDAAMRAFESDPAGTTAYGTSIGYPRLRAWIAARHGVEPERVLVTNGSMQADAFLFEQLVGSGDDVIVERPTYDRTLLSLRGRGAKVHAVELQPDGIDTDALAALLRRGGACKPKLAHIIPNFQNPAGYTLSLAKREALLKLAAKHGFLVFEDDPYVDLRFSGEKLPTMLSLDPRAGGVRVVVLKDRVSRDSRRVPRGPDRADRADRQAGDQHVHLAKHGVAVDRVRVLRVRRDRPLDRDGQDGAGKARVDTGDGAAARACRRPSSSTPEGGYFMWVTLPEGTDVNALFSVAGELGVAFVKGTDFLLEGGENTLRLAYSGVTPEQIDEGVGRLAEAFRSL